jgi:hypothetical protein
MLSIPLISATNPLDILWESQGLFPSGLFGVYGAA